MKSLTVIELFKITESINNSIERIKVLDSRNKFENQEIQALKVEVLNSIKYLKKMSKLAKFDELNFKII